MSASGLAYLLLNNNQATDNQSTPVAANPAPTSATSATTKTLNNGTTANASPLIIWGIFDRSDSLTPLFDQWSIETGIKVSYIEQEPSIFEPAVFNELAELDNGPDLLILPDRLAKRHRQQLVAIPENSLAQAYGLVPTKRLFRKVAPTPTNAQILDEYFLPFFNQTLAKQSEVYALPLAADNLGLFVNLDRLTKLGQSQPPLYWDEIQSLAQKHPDQKIINLGGTAGVPQATDLLYLLMAQNGTELFSQDLRTALFNQATVKANGELVDSGLEALGFWLSFNYQPPADRSAWQEWLSGELPIYVDYSYRIEELKQQNPKFRYTTASLPQIRDSARPLNLGQGMAMGITRQSQNKATALRLATWLTTRANAARYARSTERLPSQSSLVLDPTIRQPINQPFLNDLGITISLNTGREAELSKVTEQALELWRATGNLTQTLDQLTTLATAALRQL
ncbi:MAG: hypothetical protein CEO22_319 [Candidatus Berkelbacteria bacterium Gr01-1014_85]|uniref:Multiple sugar transport system substrate-binding protein n=1 Tax=Candidatus Berkelbacteria bacterium Gr01-1014_85 TaxID=2017150 RepID=A0A554JC56_9BACT|nr:MAG: hypothetical protein CEO22_319 [Candidatus Berkelbacteria bacterium Gr01-1014_85]